MSDTSINPKKLLLSLFGFTKDVLLLAGGDYAAIAPAVDDLTKAVDLVATALPPIDALDLLPADRAAADASAQGEVDRKFGGAVNVAPWPAAASAPAVVPLEVATPAPIVAVAVAAVPAPVVAAAVRFQVRLLASTSHPHYEVVDTSQDNRVVFADPNQALAQEFADGANLGASLVAGE